jgi:hypothetical protein
MKTLILLLTLSLTTCINSKENRLTWINNYITTFCQERELEHMTPELSIKLAYLIDKYTEKYDIPYKPTTKLCGRESNFKRFAYNSVTKARGYGQIIDFHWRYALYHIDDGKLGRYINRHNLKGIDRLKRYYYRDGYAIELMCFALSACRKHRKGDFKKGVYMYGGGNSKGACQEHMNDYMEFIF